MPQARNAKPKSYHHGDLRRALIETALQLVAEEQDWAFSLREVARRAGVSNRAPYNHFSDKLSLLSAVAAEGFDRLRDGMLQAMIGIDRPDAQLAAIWRTYVRLGLENPALYRLMFGPALSQRGSADRPAAARAAGARAREVLEQVILRGARSGDFAVPPGMSDEVAMAALAAWSGAHGLTMLVLDRIPRPELSVDAIADRLLQVLVAGLRAQQPGSPAAALVPRGSGRRPVALKRGATVRRNRR